MIIDIKIVACDLPESFGQTKWTEYVTMDIQLMAHGYVELNWKYDDSLILEYARSRAHVLLLLLLLLLLLK
jgi:hypothetical protein